LNDEFLFFYIFKMVILNLFFTLFLCEMCYGVVTEYK